MRFGSELKYGYKDGRMDGNSRIIWSYFSLNGEAEARRGSVAQPSSLGMSAVEMAPEPCTASSGSRGPTDNDVQTISHSPGPSGLGTVCLGLGGLARFRRKVCWYNQNHSGETGALIVLYLQIGMWLETENSKPVPAFESLCSVGSPAGPDSSPGLS